MSTESMMPVASDHQGNANSHHDQTDRPKNNADRRKKVREQQGDTEGRHSVPPLQCSIPLCDILHTLDRSASSPVSAAAAIVDFALVGIFGWLGYRW
jgi:hypothetical protein